LLEVGADGENLVDQVLHTDNTILAKAVLDDSVVSKSNALLVDLSVSALVNQLPGGLEVGVTIGDPWLNDLQHLESSLSHTNKDTVVDLEETEQLKDLAGLWCDLVDTLDADNENQLVLSWDVVGTILLRETGETNLLALLVTVLLNVFLGALEDDTTLLLLGLLLLLKLGGAFLSGLLLALTLLQEGFWDENLVVGGDASMLG